MGSKLHQSGCACQHFSRRDFLATGMATAAALLLPTVAQANSIQQLSGSVL